MGTSTILITVDALRADRLGQYGYYRDTMPSLDRISEEGSTFTQAFSNGPYTRISIPSFHTSRLLGYKEPESTSIASELSSNDILTSVVGTNTGWSSYEGNLGFDEFFDLRYHSSHEHAKSSSGLSKVISGVGDYLEGKPALYNIAEKSYTKYRMLANRFRSGFSWNAYPGAADVTDEVLKWVQNNYEKDFFLWVHYMEGHRPYALHDPDPRYTETITDQRNREIWETAIQSPDELTVEEFNILSDQYDSNLRYCSDHLNRLFNELEELGIWPETNIIFTSDHGEEFYEHGMFTHHNFPYDELINVPLIMSGPEIPTKQISETRELLDLGPTILGIHDVEIPESFEGENLFEGGERDVISIGSHAYDGQVISRRYNKWKYIWTESKELLYDLQSDPKEEFNLVDEQMEVRNLNRQEIPSHLFNTTPEELRVPEDEVDRAQLKALGYLE